jgi:NAD(P)-dependent dehydrogenase (short-subunit alcohol dehydrogenase family)
MSAPVQGKVALVTGASRGLGREIAVTLALAGARVALVARSVEQLRETESIITGAGGQADVFPVDLCNADEVAALRADVEARIGVPLILVNAAGIFGPIQLIKDSDPKRWIETMTINVLAPYLTCREFVGGMVDAGWGRIVNVSSAAALHQPGPLNSAYATSKAALNQFTRHLAAELEGSGVTANVIHPGDVKTDMWGAIRDEAAAMGDEGEAYRKWVRWVEDTGGDPPHKAAELVLRMMGDEAAVINGQFLWIEGGLQDPIPSWGEPVEAQPWQEQGE